MPPLTFGLRHHQVGKAFHRSEVELAILESTPGELTGLCGTKASDARKSGEHGLYDRPPAMQLKLGDVFTVSL